MSISVKLASIPIQTGRIFHLQMFCITSICASFHLNPSILFDHTTRISSRVKISFKWVDVCDGIRLNISGPKRVIKKMINIKKAAAAKKVNTLSGNLACPFIVIR